MGPKRDTTKENKDCSCVPEEMKELVTKTNKTIKALKATVKATFEKPPRVNLNLSQILVAVKESLNEANVNEVRHERNKNFQRKTTRRNENTTERWPKRINCRIREKI